MKFIDFHTHQNSNSSEIFEIVVRDFSKSQKLESATDCIGIHPWSAPLANPQDKLKEFDIYLAKNTPWLVGEIGLDRAIDTDFDIQKELFRAQIELAIKHNVQNIVLHCVRAYSDTLKIIIDSKFTGNVILHDFNSTIETSEQFEKHFNTFYSIGRRIFDKRSKAHQFLKTAPLNKLFFETDDNEELKIGEVYSEAASILDIQIPELKAQVLANFDLVSNALFTDSIN